MHGTGSVTAFIFGRTVARGPCVGRRQKRSDAAAKSKTPAVLGAVMQLGDCLNLSETEALALVKDAYQPDLQFCAASASRVLENRGVQLQVRFSRLRGN